MPITIDGPVTLAPAEEPDVEGSTGLHAVGLFLLLMAALAVIGLRHG